MLEICFPPEPNEQRRLIQGIAHARRQRQEANELLNEQQTGFDNIVDGRGDEVLPEIEINSEAEAAENGTP